MRSDSHTATNKTCFIVTSMHVTRHTRLVSRVPSVLCQYVRDCVHPTAGLDIFPLTAWKQPTLRLYVCISQWTLYAATYYMQMSRLHCWDPRPYVTFSSGDCTAGTHGHILHSGLAIATLGPTAIYYIQLWRLHCWDPRPYITFRSGDCNAGTHGHVLHSALVITLLGPTGHMSHSSAQWEMCHFPFCICGSQLTAFRASHWHCWQRTLFDRLYQVCKLLYDSWCHGRHSNTRSPEYAMQISSLATEVCVLCMLLLSSRGI